MNSTNDPTTEALLGRVRSFCFPAGEDTARLVRAIRVAEKGELRSAPGARWIPFTAEETIESTRSSFRWEARYAGGRSGWIGVTDAYEHGHGRLAMKLGGLIPIKTVRGPHADRGELQRYLASVFLCPPMLLNHGSLEWSAIGPTTLRVRDSAGPQDASVDLEFTREGQPIAVRAQRPMLVGNKCVLTPWAGLCGAFRDWEGIRVATEIEASWSMPEGAFTYYRARAMSFNAVR